MGSRPAVACTAIGVEPRGFRLRLGSGCCLLLVRGAQAGWAPCCCHQQLFVNEAEHSVGSYYSRLCVARGGCTWRP